MGEIEDLTGLIVFLFLFIFIAVFFPSFQTVVAGGNASNPAYPIVQQFPLILLVFIGIVAVYFAYEVMGD